MMNCFRYEKELQIKLTKVNPEFDQKLPFVYWRREVNMGNCIPDFIYVRYKRSPNNKILPRNATYKHALILWLLRNNGSLSFNSLAELGYFSFKKPLKKTILELMKSRAIIHLKNNNYSLSEEYQDIISEVISVEVKLKAWKTALEQAVEYKKWSDFVFVVMDSMHVPGSDSALKSFATEGVGLCSLSPSSDRLEWLVTPARIEEQENYSKEYLIASTILPKKKSYWTEMNFSNALCQALT